MTNCIYWESELLSTARQSGSYADRIPIGFDEGIGRIVSDDGDRFRFPAVLSCRCRHFIQCEYRNNSRHDDH